MNQIASPADFKRSYQDVLQHAKTIGDELALAVEAAEAAGQVIREGSGRLHQVDQKGVGDLVSEVDRTADKAVCDILKRASNIAILSEELHPELPDGEKEFWIVDPLDATSAFLMKVGNQYPAVLIALYREGKTQLGVAYFPLTGEWFYAQRGCSAFKNAKPLQITGSEALLNESWVEMNQYGDATKETKAFSQLRTELRTERGARLVTTGVPNSGVALRIAESYSTLVAAVHDNRETSVKQAPWDIAAPQLILEEAGGVFVDLDGNPTDPFKATPFVVARSSELAQRIISLMAT
ncbi:MAG: inositol monophosphatase [Mariniblastus sp.]